VFVWLSAHYPPEQAARLIPEDMRNRMRAAYKELLRPFSSDTSSYHFIRYDPHRPRHCERALAVETYLQGGAEASPEVRHLKIIRVLVYHGAGQIDRALQFAKELLPNSLQSRDRDERRILQQYCWLTRLQAAQTGRRQELQEALRVLNAKIQSPADSPDSHFENPYLYVTRARLHVALDKWDDAEKDIDRFFSRARNMLPPVEPFILRGFLFDRRGDRAGAERCWRDGWEMSKRRKEGITLPASILASFSGTFTDADAHDMVHEAMKAAGPFSPLARSIGKELFEVPFVVRVVRERWRSPRGREWAKKIAFRTAPFRECETIAVPLTLYEGFHQGAVTGSLSAEQDEVLWKLASDLFDAYSVSGTLSETQGFQGALAWTGTTNLLGWGGLKHSLAPPLRGPLAYVLGRRYLLLKKPGAADFFRTALKDAPASSPLSRLAQTELDQLASK
jgi:tetratricopeptide (TPR) repeat protein